MYAGVEFGNANYQMSCDSLSIVASSATNGGIVEVYIDSIDAGRKIAECTVANTGSWTTYKTFSAKLLSSVSGNHDVYLLFTGSVFDKLFMLQSFSFTGSKLTTGVSLKGLRGENVPQKFLLEQNYPNPFNPTTQISYALPKLGFVTLNVFDVLGRNVQALVNTRQEAGKYTLSFNAGILASGIYIYQLKAGNDFTAIKKMILLR